MPKKPYIKRVEKIGKFIVWEVNGTYIRDNIDEEFNNFGQHYRFKFIPKNEFWIDKENSPNEKKYFVRHLLIENYLMSKGSSYKKAIEKADSIELKERRKLKFIKRLLKKKNSLEIIRKIHKKLVKKLRHIEIWIVRGNIVRDLFFIDFTEGGHHKVYNFIPKNEIWLDDDIHSKERKFVLLHEIHERNLMCKGFNYEKAHHDSSKIEYFCRHHPGKLNGLIKKEFKKSTRL